MAESLCGGSATPMFKRPRLEISSNIDDNISSFDSLASTETFYHNMEFKEAVEEVTSSSDPPADINGGDSGFHDFTPPNSSSIDSTSIYGHQESQIYVSYGTQNGGFKPEADSSELLPGEQPCKSHSVQLDGHDGELDDNDAEEVASTISDLSGLSDLSNQSGHDKASTSPISWVHRQMQSGANPRMLLMEMVPRGTTIPSHLDEITLWRIILNMLREPPPRSKLPHVNTLEDAVGLLRTCHRIIVLTGAGVSVSCGIPDFRSRNGIYARLSKDYPDLPDPQAMFDIHYFRKDPRPFFKFAKEIYPGQFKPSPSHRFIQLIEKQGKLLRNYTQNIDTLEQTAGIQKVITCHGSFATATCTHCCYKVDCSVIKEDIFKQRIPFCPRCPEDIEEHGIMKPDIVFFGEGLSDEFHTTMADDRGKCDLLIVMGSSLKVRPVALIPGSIPPEVTQILINREPLKHLTFDVELLGDCDVIIGELCRRLQNDWGIENVSCDSLKEITDLPMPTTKPYSSTNNYARDSLAEVNNNAEPFLADTTCKSSDVEDSSHAQLPPSEESNSCDYRGLSAIKLEDSQDGTSQEMPNNNPDSTSEVHEAESTVDEYLWLSRRKESLAAQLPENTYLYVPPSRYVFHGAEIYSDGESDVASYTGHYNSSSDSDSSSSSEEDDDDNCETLFSEETSQSHVNADDLPSRPTEICEPENNIDSESGLLSSENSKDRICS